MLHKAGGVGTSIRCSALSCSPASTTAGEEGAAAMENTCQVKGCNCQGLNRYVEYAMLYKAAGRGRDNQAQHTVGLTCREGGGGQRQRGHMPI
jgi:hypothetical protein